SHLHMFLALHRLYPTCPLFPYTTLFRSSLASRRARIMGTEARRDGSLVINAQIPLAELADYQTELKSLTGGEGRFAMDMSHYETDRKSTRLNSSHVSISYAVFCLKKKKV